MLCKACAFCCEELGAARPPPWSILVFWAMTKAVMVDGMGKGLGKGGNLPPAFKKTSSVSIRI